MAQFRKGNDWPLLCLVVLLSALGLLPACSTVAPPSSEASETRGLYGAQAAVVLDKDTDGVADFADQCDGTVMPQPVNGAGCPIFGGKLENVEFKPDSYSLDSVSRVALDRLILQLIQHPEVVLSVGGHTDNRGNARDNLELSKKRVLAVVRYLVINGIDGRRLQPHGYGESRPLFNNSTAEGRNRNRRIEITVINNPSS